MTIFVTIIHVLVCLILIGLVLLQKGKGAEIGAVFGGSSATTLFGSRGAGNFLTKLTTWSAVVFMITSFYLAYVALSTDAGSLFGAAPPASSAAPEAAPSAPGASAPAGDFVEVTGEPAPDDGATATPTPDQSSDAPTRDSSQ